VDTIEEEARQYDADLPRWHVTKRNQKALTRMKWVIDTMGIFDKDAVKELTAFSLDGTVKPPMGKEWLAKNEDFCVKARSSKQAKNVYGYFDAMHDEFVSNFADNKL
jgi:hypothetical protein